MSRTLDPDRVWEAARLRGLSPETLARRAGMRLFDLSSLDDLTAGQLVTIAGILRVAVEELLTPEPEPEPAASTDAPRTKTRPISKLDRDDLIAVLLEYGELSEHAIRYVFGWTEEHLLGVIALALARERPLGMGVSLHRGGGRLSLVGRHAIPDRIAERLSALLAHGTGLDPAEAVLLTVAVRAHQAGPVPGPPTVSWPVLDALICKNAAVADPAATPGAAGPLIPHPDLLYALGLDSAPRRAAPPKAAP